jgi:L-seryl-tRNA(Ser) seleniumtransferase
LAAGADLVTFSGDKLMGGPQSGIIAGRADLVKACASHPLARALRPGGLVLSALHHTVLAYLARTATTDIPFWRMAAAPWTTLRTRAEAIIADAGRGVVADCDSLPGAGSTPGASIASVAIALTGDHLVAMRNASPPLIARVRDDTTYIDVRTIDPADDGVVASILRSLD